VVTQKVRKERQRSAGAAAADTAADAAAPKASAAAPAAASAASTAAEGRSPKSAAGAVAKGLPACRDSGGLSGGRRAEPPGDVARAPRAGETAAGAAAGGGAGTVALEPADALR
jgi:hypothetical protein